MGVRLHQVNTKFCIKSENKAAALAAVKALASQRDKMSRGSSTGEKWFAFVTTESFLNAETLEDALWAFRWDAETSLSGDIAELSFAEERYGDEDVLFAALAPFVVSGSYIKATADDEPFRWRFQDGKLHIDSGRIIYDGD